MLDKLDELFPSWAQNHTDHCRSEIYESADSAEEERMPTRHCLDFTYVYYILYVRLAVQCSPQFVYFYCFILACLLDHVYMIIINLSNRGGDHCSMLSNLPDS